VFDFLNKLNKRLTPLLESDLKNYQSYTKDKIEQWDIPYYYRLHNETSCDINLEEVREYFPCDIVTKGLLETYQELLSLTFTEIKTDNIWHKTVQLYEVTEATKLTEEKKKVLGYFYLDLYPRDGKYSHACCSNIMSGNIDNPSVVAMICNFTQDAPLSFGEVVTFFHEFGHVMHRICSKTLLLQNDPSGTERDFIEAPSQMLEEFCYEPIILKKMSKHIKTGEPLSDDLIMKIRKQKPINNGYYYKRQLMFALFDMKVHTEKLKVPLGQAAREFMEQIMLHNVPPEINWAAQFAHISRGYQAGYYGYIWSEVYARDMFHTHFKKNPLDKVKGMLYREKILKPGSSKDAKDLLIDFLGREPSEEEFLKDLGL